MSVQTTIDEETAAVIRSALAAAQAGRIEEACAIGERGLADGGDPAPLRAMLGSLLAHAGDAESALPHLAAAHKARPADPVIAANLASVLGGRERYSEMLTVLTEDLVNADRSGRLRRLRGFAAQMSDDFAAAIVDFERVVADEPSDWETWNNLGNAQASAGDFAGATVSLGHAVRLNPAAAPTRLNLARAMRDVGDLVGAEAELRAMAVQFPDDALPLTDLYHVLLALGREDSEVEEALAQVVVRDPRNVELLLELGGHQIRTFGFAKAETTFRTTLEVDPSSGHAYFGLAQVFEHVRPAALDELAAQAERAGIDDDSMNLIRAFAARRQKNYRAGLDALSRLPDDLETATRWHLAGQMLDLLGEYDEAFDAFTRMNDANARHESEPLRRATDLRDRLRGDLARMTPHWRDSFAAPPMPAERPAPVFLAGFPRSGTTLLDTMLMGHPDVEVMEEQPVLRQLEIEFGGVDALAALDADAVRAAQNRYFELAATHTPLREGSLLIDKSPLYLQRVSQIWRLFPDARFILALRHPADVVLSCFMSNFRLNSSMANFLHLDTAAEFYDLTFALWEKARGLFPVDVHTVVYERLIEDPEAQLKPVVEALGLDWRAGMTDHQDAAQSRGVITTASYAQVTQPLYRGAAGRWQHYRRHLEPIFPALRPWVEKFGYDL